MKRRTPNYPHFQRLLKKYLAGKSNEAEQFLIESWYQHFDKKENLAVPGITTDQEESRTRDRLYANILAGVDRPVWHQSRWLKVAATLFVISGVAVLIWAYLGNRTSTAENLVYQTGPREMKRIRLADSSLVWLNANSYIRVDSDFGQKERKLNLRGEARFEVIKNSLRPFQVSTDVLVIRVLGTGFNVSAYRGAKTVSVGVKHGSVQVRDSRHLLGVLAGGKRLRYQSGTGQFKIDGLGATASAWSWGLTVLEKADYEELQQALLNVYGLQIRTTDKEVLKSKYNLSLPAHLNPDQALTLLVGIIDKKFKKRGDNEVVIY